MTVSSPEIREEIDRLERKHAESPGGRYFVPLANALRRAGDTIRAKWLLEEGLKEHPEYVSAHVVLGRCFQDEGEFDDAEARFRHILTLDPQNLVALRTLGDLAVGARRLEDAREWYQQLLAVDPMNEEAREALAALDGAGEQEAREDRSDDDGVRVVDAGAMEESVMAAESIGQVAETPGADRTPAAADAPPAERTVAEDELEILPEVTAGTSDAIDYGGGTEMIDLGDRGPDDSTDGEMFEEDSAVVTETIAELYTRQGFYERAASVYRELIRRRGPDLRLEELLNRVERLAAGDVDASFETVDVASSTDGEAGDVDADPFADSFSAGFPAIDESGTGAETGVEAGFEAEVPSAAQTEVRSSETIRDYLRGVLAWSPGTRVPFGTSGAALAEPAAGGEASPADDAADRLESGTAGGMTDATERELREVPADDSADMKVPDETPLAASASDVAAAELAMEDGESPRTVAPVGDEAEPELLAEAAAGIPAETDEEAPAADAAPEPLGDQDLFPWELPPAEAPADDSSEAGTSLSYTSGEEAAEAADRSAADEDGPRLGDEAELPAELPEDQRTTPPPAGNAAVEGSDDDPDRTPSAASAPTGPDEAENEESADDDDDLESFQAWLRSLKR